VLTLINFFSGGRCVNEDGTLDCVQRGASSTKIASELPDSGVYSKSNDTQPIWLDELSCTGEEKNIGECLHSFWGLTDCGHKEDAGCICTSGPTISLVRGK
jgi:Scavenger receptor cysteine-rich domain